MKTGVMREVTPCNIQTVTQMRQTSLFPHYRCGGPLVGAVS